MKKRFYQWFAACVLILSFFAACSMPAGENPRDIIINTPQNEDELYAAGEIIVKTGTAVSIAEIDALVPGTCVKTFAVLGGSQYLLYDLFDDKDPDLALAVLMASGKVEYAEKNAVYSLCKYIPDDPFYREYQYAPHITQCETGWEIETGSPDIIVAVIDTGINGRHEDLAERVIAGRDVIRGIDIAPNVNSDENGHGSHVAGIIGARGNNGKGIAGLAWNVKLMPVKIFAPGIFTNTAHIAEALIWAIDHGADVVNMSFGSEVFSMTVNDAVHYAHQNNVVLVAAMGNDLKSKLVYPAGLPGVIAVGATNGRDEISFFSTKGNHISVAAPGESIYSLGFDSAADYKYGSGTSMACPFVAGLAALLLSHNPALVPGEVRSMIEDSADPLGTAPFSPEYGHGRVNVYNALTIPVHNNYKTITVDVTNKGNHVGGVKVLLEDTTSGVIIQSGLTSFEGIKGGTAGRLVFKHIRTGNYKVRVHVGAAQDALVNLDGAGDDPQVAFAFNTPIVLVVNAIKEMNTSLLTDEFYYAQELTRLGKYYTIWNVLYNGIPTSELISGYDMVVWYTGKTRDDPDNNLQVLSPGERTVLRDYMDEGGRLYLCGNNIAESLATVDPDFLGSYLHARYITSPLSHEEITGSGFLEEMNLILYLEDDDRIGIEAGAVGILDASDEPDENHWAGLCWDTGYRLVFTTLCPNEVLYCDPPAFFADIISWLDLQD